MKKAGEKFEQLIKIVEELREKCPWDRVQTFETMKPFLLEEVKEAIDAIDNRDYPNLAEELGDMLLHIVMISVFAKESSHFKIDDVIELISAKMIRRHPHVFGKKKLKTKEAVLKMWQEVKKKEKAGRKKTSKMV
jgi:tetrapyrrole methylase family protein/MazG family protein